MRRFLFGKGRAIRETAGRTGPAYGSGEAARKTHLAGDFHRYLRKIIEFACVGAVMERRVSLCHRAWLPA